MTTSEFLNAIFARIPTKDMLPDGRVGPSGFIAYNKERKVAMMTSEIEGQRLFGPINSDDIDRTSAVTAYFKTEDEAKLLVGFKRHKMKAVPVQRLAHDIVTEARREYAYGRKPD